MSSLLVPPAELRKLSMSEAKRLSVGGRIRWARVRKYQSHDQLAGAAGTTRSHLIKVEKGLHMPSLELRARIAVATDQPADFFQDGDSDDEEEAELVRDLVAVLRKLIAREGALA